jgi:integrase
MALSDIQIKAAKPREKVYKLFDSGGLYLRIEPSGSRLWRFKYRVDGFCMKTNKPKLKEKSLSFGSYPDVSLKEAREKRDDARKLIGNGKDPGAERRDEKLAAISTFALCAERYVEKHSAEVSSDTTNKARQWLRDYLNPRLGNRPIGAITAPEMIQVLRGIEASGKLQTAHRAQNLASRVFQFALAEGAPGLSGDPAASVKRALKSHSDEHLPAITAPAEVGELLRDIEGYGGDGVARLALKLLPHVFLRQGSLRGGEWKEIDWDNAQWIIPKERMKGRGAAAKRPHLVPLSRQSIAILKELQAITGKGNLMFPARGSTTKPISHNTLQWALEKLGYGEGIHTPHSFRTTASTLLHDLGYDTRDIELQLAHKDSNKVRGIYARHDRVAERTVLMQRYSDYLDQLRDGGNVVAIGGRRVA